MDHRRKRLQELDGHYDIREIPEDLYLAVLARRKAESDCGVAGLG